jgi:hypothetical protein
MWTSSWHTIRNLNVAQIVSVNNARKFTVTLSCILFVTEFIRIYPWQKIVCNDTYTVVEERPHSWFSPSAHAVSGIPPKLHQSDNSDHTKWQFEFVTGLGQSSISNYAACSVHGLLCVQWGYWHNSVQCKSTSELLMMWGRYPHIDTSPHTVFVVFISSACFSFVEPSRGGESICKLWK